MLYYYVEIWIENHLSFVSHHVHAISLKVVIESENSFLFLLLKKVPRAENKLPKNSNFPLCGGQRYWLLTNLKLITNSKISILSNLKFHQPSRLISRPENSAKRQKTPCPRTCRTTMSIQRKRLFQSVQLLLFRLDTQYRPEMRHASTKLYLTLMCCRKQV